MPPINFTTSILAAFGMALVARAFFPLIKGQVSDFAGHMIKGVVIVAIVIFARSLYWDGAQFFLGDQWKAVSAALGGQKFSTVFNLPIFWALYHFMQARLEIIPDDERDEWRWWSAWAHPGDRCVINWRKRK